MATQLFPILATPDLQRSLAFYRDLLGGRVSYEFPGPDGAPAYVGLDIGEGSHLGIGIEPAVGNPALPRPISLWIYVGDVDAMVETMRDAGVTVREEPADQPWGERVARVLDPDGNEVILGARATASA
jgi:lactoylglutathione lyase